jgi:hypothetical protein
MRYGGINEMTERKRGNLWLKANMCQSESNVYWGEGDGVWNLTPFTVANCAHDWNEAFWLVRKWLKGERQ